MQEITGMMECVLSLEDIEKIKETIAANNTQENTGQVFFQPLQNIFNPNAHLIYHYYLCIP